MALDDLGNLFVSIRATSDAYAKDMQSIKASNQALTSNVQQATNAIVASWGKTGTEAQAAVAKMARVADVKSAVKDLASSTDSLVAGWGKTGKAAEESLHQTHGSTLDAHAALKGMEQLLGVELPASATRFLSHSTLIGPALTTAFSSVAVIGMISALAELPKLFDELSGKVTGWDETAKKAYASFIEENKAAEAAMIKVLVAQNNLANRNDGVKAAGGELKIYNDLLLDTQKRATAINTELLNLKDAQKGIGAALANAVTGKDITNAEQIKELEEAFKKTNVEAAKYADKVNELRKIEIPKVTAEESDKQIEKNKKALEEYFKMVADLRKSTADFDFSSNLAFFKDTAQNIAEINTELNKHTAEFVKGINEDVKALTDALKVLNHAFDIATFNIGNVRGGVSDLIGQPGAAAANPITVQAFAAMEAMRQAGREFIDGFINDVSKMFTDMIGHGKSFWEAFKGLGTTVLASIADQFLKTMLHGFLDPFAASLGKVLSKVASSVGGSVEKNASGSTDSGSGFSVSNLIKGGAIAAATTAAIAGVVALGHAITGMFHQLAAQASAFVKSTQDPFTAATKSMFDTLDAARSAGTLTVAQVKEASAGFEKMWADFQEASAKQGIVGQQALATMTPFVSQWEDWLKSLEEAGKELERQAAIKGFSDRLTTAADSLDPLNIAIGNLVDGGYSAAQVMKFLGGDIQNMIDVCKALNIELPSSVQFMSDFIDQLAAMDRVKNIDAELQSISDQIGQALIQKMDLLDGQMQKSKDNIANWTTQIATLDQQIADQTKNLNDASYWQKQYDDAVKASADNLQQLTDKRKSLEQQISTLETEMQRQALVDAVEKAKGQGQVAAAMFTQTFAGITKAGHAFTASLTTNLGGGTTGNQALADAQAALDAFDKAQAALAKQQKAIELNDLRQQLAETITAQAAARDAYADASAAAQENIHAQKEQLAAGIELAKTQKQTLLDNIAQEYERIGAIQKDIDATQKLMDTMGVARTDEMAKINSTITALINRGVALANERQALQDLYGASMQASVGITALINALHNAQSSQQQPVVLPVDTSGQRDRNFPSFDNGGYVNRSGMAFVHAGERVVPAEKVAMSGSGDIHITINVDGNVTTQRDLEKSMLDAVKRAVERGGVRIPATEVRR